MEKVIVSLHMFDVCACLINGPKIQTKELSANGMYDMYVWSFMYMCTTQFQPKDHYWIASWSWVTVHFANADTFAVAWILELYVL